MTQQVSSVYDASHRQMRTYRRAHSAIFLKTKERYGGLSNMAGGFPLRVNDIRILTSEALYQACRFPHRPELQRLIIGQRSPMTAKMKSKPHRHDSRRDWNKVRVAIMRWCLRVKLAQHWEAFGELLQSTGDLPIVEQSRKDDFWGAKPADEQTLHGVNALGRLLMELRALLRSEPLGGLLQVAPPGIPEFLLDGHPIKQIVAIQPRPTQSVSRQPLGKPLTTPTAVHLPLSRSGQPGTSTAQENSSEYSTDRDTKTIPPYSAYRNSGIEWMGNVPAHWNIGRLKYSLTNIVEQVTQAPKRGTIVALENVESWTGRIRPAASDSSFDSQLKCFQSGDILFAKLRPYLAKVARPASGGLCVGEFLVLRPRDEIMGAYLEQFLRSKSFIDEVTASTFGAKMPRTDWRRIGGMSIPHPPFAEQTAIVRFLDHVDQRIRHYVQAKRKLIVLLQESRTALINDVVTQGLDPQVQTHSTRSQAFPHVPKNWTFWRVGRLIRRVRRPMAVRPDEVYREIGIRSWGKGIFHKNPVRGATLGEKSVFRIKPGDFVLNIVFAWEGAVSVVSKNEIDMIASHRFPTFLPSPEVDIDYLLMVFQSEQGRRLMDINSPGAAGRNKTLRITEFLSEEIPLPPVEEQKAVVATFRKRERTLVDSVARTRRVVHNLEQFRKALILAVVTGKIDVRETVAHLPDDGGPEDDGDGSDGMTGASDVSQPVQENNATEERRLDARRHGVGEKRA